MEAEHAQSDLRRDLSPARRSLALDIVSWTLSTALGVTFLLSAVGKALSISDFQWTFRDLGFYRPFAFLFSHGLVALEFVIGVFLLMQFRLRRLTLPLVVLSLLLFSGYLAFMLDLTNNQEDCGCFGALAAMTPLAALVKNSVMLAAAVVLWIVCRPAGRRFRFPAWALLTVLVSATAFAIPERFDISPLYSTPNQPKPSIDLTKGKHIVAFMSLTCSHCRDAAKHFKAMHDSDASLPFYLVLAGHADARADFFQETGAEGLPHTFFSDPPAFIKMAGSSVPSIMLLDNSHIDEKVYERELTVAGLRKWLRD